MAGIRYHTIVLCVSSTHIIPHCLLKQNLGITHRLLLSSQASYLQWRTFIYTIYSTKYPHKYWNIRQDWMKTTSTLKTIPTKITGCKFLVSFLLFYPVQNKILTLELPESPSFHFFPEDSQIQIIWVKKIWDELPDFVHADCFLYSSKDLLVIFLWTDDISGIFSPKSQLATS